MIYPEAVEINGAEYAINTGYEYAVACFKYISDPDLTDTERALGVIDTLYKDAPPDDVADEALRIAIKFLKQGQDVEHEYRRPDMDFEADETYIKASFLSDYKIDLDDVNMHWWKFCTLLQGLTDDCILNRVRDLRNYDISTVKDPRAKSKLIKAQRDVALPSRISEEEQNVADNFFSQLLD